MVVLRDYLLGTLIGIGLGIVPGTTFAHQLADAVRHPGLGAIALLAAIGIALVTISLAL